MAPPRWAWLELESAPRARRSGRSRPAEVRPRGAEQGEVEGSSALLVGWQRYKSMGRPIVALWWFSLHLEMAHPAPKRGRMSEWGVYPNRHYSLEQVIVTQPNLVPGRTRPYDARILAK